MYSRTLFTSLSPLLLAFVSATPTPKFKFPAPINYISAAKSSDMRPDHLSKRNPGGVRLSDGANFTEHVWYGIFPLYDCISLGDYAHNVLSFRPDEESYCLVMQGQCDGDAEYTEVHHDSPNIGDLSVYDFVADLESYMCFDEDPELDT